MLLFILALIVGLALLTWSSEQFVSGSVNLARITGLSPLVIGMVVMGFGTSAPELLVSANAALNGSPGLALGNAIGSNIANIALILGTTALLVSLDVNATLTRMEIPALFFAAILSWLFMADGFSSHLDGFLLLLTLCFILFWFLRCAKAASTTHLAIAEDAPVDMRKSIAIFWTLTGLLLLIVGSRLLVWGSSGIASLLGVSDLVIGLTIVAIGTSLPELAASLVSVRKGQAEMAIGNIIGSCLFNNLAVVGLAVLLHPLSTPTELLSRDMPIMLGLYVLLVIFLFTPPQRYSISRWEGGLLLLIFIVYQWLLYHSQTA